MGRKPKKHHFQFKLAKYKNEQTASDISAFGINGVEHYRSYYGPVSQASVSIAKLNYEIDSTVSVQHVFLRIITSGKNLTLLSYEDNIKERYFISENGAQPIELKYVKYISQKVANKVESINTYQQQLQRLVAKYQTGNKNLIDLIQRTNYEMKELKKVVLMINGNEDLTPAQKTSRTGSQFFLGAGANITQYTFRKNAPTILNGATVSSTFPYIGTGVDYYLNNDIRKLIFRAELGITGAKVNYSTATLNNNGSELTFNQLSAIISPQIIYNFYNTSNFKIYLGAGLAFNVNNYTNHHYYNVYYLGNIRSQSLDNNLKMGSDMNVVARAGTRIKNIEIYGAYSPSAANAYFEKVTAYRVGVNYLFGKKQL